MSRRISVLGGYLGATHAARMADLGPRSRRRRRRRVQDRQAPQGQLSFFEPGLDENPTRNIEAGRLRFTCSYEETAFADVRFLAVGTPREVGGLAADLRFVDAMVDGRDCLDPSEWCRAGWTYRSFGRP